MSGVAATPFIRLAYVAGKYRGCNAWEVEQNIRAAEAVAYEVALLGLYPICPHTNTRGWFESARPEGEFWLAATLELMRRCDAVLMLPGWHESSGARAEYAEALHLGLPVFETLPDIAEWYERQRRIAGADA